MKFHSSTFRSTHQTFFHLKLNLFVTIRSRLHYNLSLLPGLISHFRLSPCPNIIQSILNLSTLTFH
jgi:hypothetical protein